MAQRDSHQRVELSWRAVLGEEDETEPHAHAQKLQKKSKSNRKSKKKTTAAVSKPESKDTKSRPRRKKLPAKNTKTKQGMNAVVDSDGRSEGEIMDTFDDAGFVLVDLESELEVVATEDGFASVRTGTNQRNKNKGNDKTKVEDQQLSVDTLKEAKKKVEKEGQAQKLKDLVRAKNAKVKMVTVEAEKKKKQKIKEKNGKEKQETVNAAAAVAEGMLRQGNQKKKNEHPKTKEVQEMSRDCKQKPKNQEKATKGKPTIGLKKKEVLSSLNKADEISKKSAKKKKYGRDEVATFVKYVNHGVVQRGLETGGLLQGKLHVNAAYRMDGYITVNGLAIDVLVKGMHDRNRALDGDLVAVRLHPESQWKVISDDSNKRATKAFKSKPMSSSVAEDQNALHSLWLPNVETKGFYMGSAGKDGCVDELKQSLDRLNERIRSLGRRPTAYVVFILVQGNVNGFIGSLEPATKVKDNHLPLPAKDNYALFNADDQRLPRRIRIPRLQLPDEFISRPLLYSKTMLCICRVNAWSTRHQSPMGEFVKTVGEYTGIETGVSAILSKHGLQAHTLDFDSAILSELDQMYGTSGEKWEIPQEEFQKRRDFRATPIISIDPYNARDLDDALHIRALNETRTTFEIGVHIADVTHFIKHKSLLDIEAQSRATSVYLANRVLPMLPRLLCEKLCSLQPQVDRLAFSVVWQMNVDGTLVDGVAPWFGKSIIRSCCKLDYGSAQKMLDGVITSDNVDEWEKARRPGADTSPNITNATVVQSVKDLWSIGINRRTMRFKTGAVCLNDVKLVFSLDAKGNPTCYGPYELKDSNRLVEEYMLLANYLVAQQLLRAHGPLAFLRHHPPPVSRAIEQALELLDKNDIQLDGSSTKQLTESLERVRQDYGETTFVIVQALIIKPMKPAEYMVAGNGASADSWRHYALNIPYYTHFTSPIRRYADVVVHRLLQESLVGSSAHDAGTIESKMVEYTSIAQNCNEKNRMSKNAEKACDKVFLCAYVRHHGDLEVTGVVLSMGQKSFTVYILELGLEQQLFLQEINLKGLWKNSQLLIRLPAPKNESKVVNIAKGDETLATKAKKIGTPKIVALSILKHLRLRMSTTKKLPLALTFTVIGEK